MSLEANKQVIRDFFGAISSGDPEASFAHLHEDIVWTIIGDTPVSKTFRGHADVQENLLGVAVRQLKPDVPITLEVIELIAEGDRVVARVQGTCEGLHGPYNNTYCHVFTLRDGKIIEDFEYCDTALIYQSWYGQRFS